MGWVSAKHAVSAEVRLYDRLFKTEDAGLAKDFLSVLNENSLEINNEGKFEPAVLEQTDYPIQFERIGYFIRDAKAEMKSETIVFNRTVTLRDNWSKSN